MLIKYSPEVEKELKSYVKDIRKKGYSVTIRYIISKETKEIYLIFRAYKYDMSEMLEKTAKLDDSYSKHVFENMEIVFTINQEDELLSFITSNHYLEAYKDDRRNMIFTDNMETIYHSDTIVVAKCDKNNRKGTYISHSDIGTNNTRMIRSW